MAELNELEGDTGWKESRAVEARFSSFELREQSFQFKFSYDLFVYEGNLLQAGGWVIRATLLGAGDAMEAAKATHRARCGRLTTDTSRPGSWREKDSDEDVAPRPYFWWANLSRIDA